MKRNLYRVLFLACVLGLWELAASTVISPFWISKPTLIIQRLFELLLSGQLIWHSSITITEAFIGLTLGMVVGVPIGLALGLRRAFAEIVDPFIAGLYSLPRVALAPLFIIWFGIGLLSKVMLAFSLVVFIFILNIQDGLRNGDRELSDLMKTMRAPRAYVIRKVLLPSVVPWIFASLRIGLGLALIGAVISEVIGASRGLGWYIEYSSGQFDTTGAFAGLVVLMIIAMLGNELVKLVENRVLHWRDAENHGLAG